MKIHNKIPYFWVIFGLMAISIVVVTGCCIGTPMQKEAGADPSVLCESTNQTLPDVYTAPFGGFNQSLFLSFIPNDSIETDYIFYSRNYGPGEVILDISSSENVSVKVTPATFIAEPNHTYSSHISVNLGPGTGTKGVSINVTLANNFHHFGDDGMTIYTDIHPGMISLNQDLFSAENDTIVLKKGDCQQYNLTYYRGLAEGLGTIDYTPSETPFSVSIVPSHFIAKHGVGSPSKLILYAPPSLPSGKYIVNLTVNGSSQELMNSGPEHWNILDDDEKIIHFKVSVE
jgi:hypothetical protein